MKLKTAPTLVVILAGLLVGTILGRSAWAQDMGITRGAGVTSVSVTAPLTTTGGTSPTLAMPAASGSSSGYMWSSGTGVGRFDGGFAVANEFIAEQSITVGNPYTAGRRSGDFAAGGVGTDGGIYGKSFNFSEALGRIDWALVGANRWFIDATSNAGSMTFGNNTAQYLALRLSDGHVLAGISMDSPSFLGNATAATNTLTSNTNDATASGTVGAWTYKPSVAMTANDLIHDFQNSAGSHLLTIDQEGDLVALGGVRAAFGGNAAAYGVAQPLSKQYTAAGTGAGTTEYDLMTFSLPAASLGTDGKSVRFVAWGDGVSTTDATTVRCYFGATIVASAVLTITQANTWRTEFEVIRSGATTQVANGMVINGAIGVSATAQMLNTSPAETLANAITIKCTGQRAISSVANSVRQLGMSIEGLN